MMDAIIYPEVHVQCTHCFYLVDLIAIIALTRLITAVVISTRIFNVSIILTSFPLVCIYYTPILFICQYLYLNFCIKIRADYSALIPKKIHK